MFWQKLSWISCGIVAAQLTSCDSSVSAPALSKSVRQLPLGQQVPEMSEQAAIGTVATRVSRQAPDFRTLTHSRSTELVFKDEEATGADRVMTALLEQRLHRLNHLVQEEWDGVRLRITEAWDENGEHGPLSAHYEGRAADLTTSDLDSGKLGRLAYLAVEAGFDWVYFENTTHVHASVRK